MSTPLELAATLVVLGVIRLPADPEGTSRAGDARRRSTGIHGRYERDVTTGNTAQKNTRRGGNMLWGMQHMLPGDHVSGTVGIGNGSKKAPARFYLGLSKLVETKGPGGGRLSYRLVLVVKQLSNRRRAKVLYRGPLRRMPLMKLGKFRPRERREYKFTVLFPDGPSSLDNRFQGSAVSLQFTWLARQAR